MCPVALQQIILETRNVCVQWNSHVMECNPLGSKGHNKDDISLCYAAHVQCTMKHLQSMLCLVYIALIHGYL